MGDPPAARAASRAGTAVGPDRCRVHRHAGPVGVVTWTPAGGDETLVATVTGYLPGAVDGWTWAKDLFIAAATGGDVGSVGETCSALGVVVADLHAHCAGRPPDRRPTTRNAGATAHSPPWPRPACWQVRRPHRCSHRTRRRYRTHPGRVVRTGRCAGPRCTRRPARRSGAAHRRSAGASPTSTAIRCCRRPNGFCPLPAAVDLAGILQSLSHVAVVAAKRSELGTAALAEVDRVSRAALYDAYIGRPTQGGER